MTADTVGGVWQYSLELAEALGAHGVEVVLATMGAPLSSRQRTVIRRVPNLVISESSYKLEWMEEPWADVEMAGRWLLGLESIVQPDIIHLNSYVHAALPWQAPKLIVAHSCVYSWFAAVQGHEPPPSWERYRKSVSEGLRRADAVTAPTASMLAVLENFYGSFQSAGRIFNGRNAEAHSPAEKESFVLTAGRLWDEAKNIAALERVAQHIQWPVFAAGPAAHPDGGTASFVKLKLLGNLDGRELARWMGRAAIYALPARYEPFGLSVLEAALAGCALVLGDIPSLRELWDEAALFVPPDDDATLQEALDCLTSNTPFRNKFARRARARALQFSPEHMAREYLSLYRRMASEKGKQGPLMRDHSARSTPDPTGRLRILRLQ
ncbi:MAG: glycosyltransferase [Candidatus Abyssobacteria bacterium SURF_5]|uniref:Glycosyltransferase n=1 Tax=Abyssobacteria bacterium (strain SURF_5) TaxID=2093360 RepID=A0A3A4MVS9_ABYX5|nr:MAG: glycosyltransferase [Candidatus Abyssubacteria bacterium SURF_5]